MNRILVVGDTILDRFVVGSVSRVNPEAPALILDQESEEDVLGGACNVAANIRTLSTDKSLSIDYFGMGSAQILSMLSEYSIDFFGVACTKDDILTKTRYVSQGKHLIRVDKNKKYDDELCLAASKLIKGLRGVQYDLIVISDYDKGTLSSEIADFLFSLDVPILFDVKRFRPWLKNVDLSKCILKCNEKEYNEGINHLLWEKRGPMIVTLGSRGYNISSFAEDDGLDIEHFSVEPLKSPAIDVVGAGDTFLAGMVAGFLWGSEFDAKAMARMGNKAAAIKVQQFGTRAVKWT